MKKPIIFILSLAIIILAIIYTRYINYKSIQKEIKKNNLEYEFFLDKSVFGTELTTVINRAVDNNEKYKVPKDENGFYIQNNTNSVEIEIKITDNDTTYQMETLYGGGMAKFVAYYNSIYFECTKIEYNSKGKVSYMLFEQKN